jgi:hypothetical protein
MGRGKGKLLRWSLELRLSQYVIGFWEGAGITDYRWCSRSTTVMKVVETLWIQIVKGRANMEEITLEVVCVERA